LDLAAALSLTTSGKGHLEIAAFCSQQCVEKNLKALIASTGIEPRLTHNVQFLAAQATQCFPAISPDLDDLAFLTVFAVQLRYTDEIAVDPEVIAKAVTAAQRVTRVVEQVLGPLEQGT